MKPFPAPVKPLLPDSFVMPRRSGKYVAGETLTYRQSATAIYSVTFIRYDGSTQAYVMLNDCPVPVFTYNLSR